MDRRRRRRRSDLGFAGFRLHAPINRADYFDEVAAFLGASYFRAVAKGQAYGLSARGLALKTGEPGPEEFPVFKAFWLERPARGANAIVVHALLDSPSAARRRTASRSRPARRRCSTSTCACIRASRWRTPASRR